MLNNSQIKNALFNMIIFFKCEKCNSILSNIDYQMQKNIFKNQWTHNICVYFNLTTTGITEITKVMDNSTQELFMLSR